MSGFDFKGQRRVWRGNGWRGAVGASRHHRAGRYNDERSERLSRIWPQLWWEARCEGGRRQKRRQQSSRRVSERPQTTVRGERGRMGRKHSWGGREHGRGAEQMWRSAGRRDARKSQQKPRGGQKGWQRPAASGHRLFNFAWATSWRDRKPTGGCQAGLQPSLTHPRWCFAIDSVLLGFFGSAPIL